MIDIKVQKAAQLLENAGQIILQGAPGCGKTYVTTELAVYLCNGILPEATSAEMQHYRQGIKNEYRRLRSEGRVEFTTFHQTLDYEEFVEGLKPVEGADGDVRFVVRDGIFKRIALKAASDPKHKYVLVIDEINRANISKVLGELITLLEKSKRLSADDEFTCTLPYSGDEFGVPANLYVIGTMNTADRSIGCIDYAIRRRFAFMTLEADPFVILEYYHDNGDLVVKERNLFNDVRQLINQYLNPDYELQDVMIGHSYFLAPTQQDYEMNLEYKIRPLLDEYRRDGILVDKDDLKEKIRNIGKK